MAQKSDGEEKGQCEETNHATEVTRGKNKASYWGLGFNQMPAPEREITAA